MKDRKNLLSIGKLSKLTGVHVKSLRYYDRLGILPPAYVDPASGYRYYAFFQVYMVEAIQLCVDLDIPLKQFTDFLLDGDKISYAKLVDVGAKMAREKIRAIQDKLAFLEEGRQYMAYSEAFMGSAEPLEYGLPAVHCLTVPLTGQPSMERCYEQVAPMVRLLKDKGLKSDGESGLLARYDEGGPRYSVFVQAWVPPEREGEALGLMRLPAMRCRAVRTGEGDAILRAPQAFPDLFQMDYPRYVMQSDLFLGVYDTVSPKYELRCSLPQGHLPGRDGAAIMN